MDSKIKDSEIYLRAAERVFMRREYYDQYSCIAVDRETGSRHKFKHSAEARKYAKTFAEGCVSLQTAFMECGVDKDSVRVLALLFMHQIALDEERNK